MSSKWNTIAAAPDHNIRAVLVTMGKGVSAAEKKERLLAAIHEGTGVYSSKEIMKIKVSFPSQAIESVLAELVSDDLVVRSRESIPRPQMCSNTRTSPCLVCLLQLADSQKFADSNRLPTAFLSV